MIYPFMTLEDDTEIVHSEMKNNGEVKVYIETSDEEDGFHHMTCYLPSYRIEDEFGYNEDEIQSFLDIVKRNEKRILEASRK